jgi:excinuclease ABC subunit C
MTDSIGSADFDSKRFLQNITGSPGVYRMLGRDGKVLYVGKARNLRKRLTSYFRKTGQTPKTRLLMSNTCSIETTVTNTENEALLLENNLIKEHKPRYNILLRDDKSYPYIYISTQHKYPRITSKRGAKTKQGQYFGPYPSSGAVREAINLMQKVFRIRQCEDSYFNNRSRPCLQYQIKRCTAPCVGYISEEDYAKDINYVILFLQGKNQEILDDLNAAMQTASGQQDYETAAIYRDQIQNLRKIQEKQYISSGTADIDVIACQCRGGVCAVQVFMIRNGLNLGNRSYFPQHSAGADETDVMSAFLSQYYIGKYIPPGIVASHVPDDKALIENALAGLADRKIRIVTNTRGVRSKWLDMAKRNASIALDRRLASRTAIENKFKSLQESFSLPEIPSRIECFDVSHTSGEAAVASCVVFDGNGPVKSDYRRFNIKGVTAGDDYAAIRQAIERRYSRLVKEDAIIPDLLLIDGGKGQLKQAEDIINELQLERLRLIGVAKGPDRKPGYEKLFVSGRTNPITLPQDSPALHLIQQIRDEAHRFAIAGHRQQRSRARNESPLEGIAGLGPKRRRTLLNAFGGLQGIARAGVDDLAAIDGISRKLARQVYDAFHDDNG